MMLVYNLPAIQAIHQRFGGISGSAYFVGGFGDGIDSKRYRPGPYPIRCRVAIGSHRRLFEHTVAHLESVLTPVAASARSEIRRARRISLRHHRFARIVARRHRQRKAFCRDLRQVWSPSSRRSAAKNMAY
jgi:hypothetical protein